MLMAPVKNVENVGQVKGGRKRASGLTQCKVLQERTKFQSNSTKETFKIRKTSILGVIT